MRIAIGADHRGYKPKQALIQVLRHAGHEVHDVGCGSDQRCDYPDMAFAAATAVRDGQADVAVLICGSGLGMAMAANKVFKVRAAPVFDTHSAEMSRRHNNANVLCLSADMTSEAEMQKIVDVWLKSEFEGGRHQRRVDQLADFERRQAAEGNGRS